MAALRLDGIFPEINETGIMPGLFEMEGQIGIVFQGNNDAFFISFYILRCQIDFRITLSAIVLRR